MYHNFIRIFSILTVIPLLTTLALWVKPTQAGNPIQMEAVADVIPACDILGQTVGRLVESVSGDGGDIPGNAFTRGVLLSEPITTGPGTPTNGFGQLAYVGLSCTPGANTIATITSPIQISGQPLRIFTATTRMYAPAVPTTIVVLDPITGLPFINPLTGLPITIFGPISGINAADILLPLSQTNSEFTDARTIIGVVGDETVQTSDAVVILGENAAYSSTTGVPRYDALFGFGFNIMVEGDRIPAGQYGFATILTVVPR